MDNTKQAESNNTNKNESAVNSQQKKVRSDFIFLNVIGEGSFSMVHLVEEKKTNKKFALKECDKFQVLKEKKVKYIHLEKNILAEILTDHPFIIKLCFTFHDESSLYFGLTYCSNGDLLDYTRKYESFFRNDIYYTQFYTAEIIDAVEYMHSKNVIHRDVKPENILVDERRHIKLTDFGTARILEPIDELNYESNVNNIENNLNNLKLNEENDEKKSPRNEIKHKRANSFVGTAQYVSPEILKSRPVHKGCDIWAIGCIVYQLTTGKHLFTGGHEYDIFQKVVKVSYTLPDNFPINAKDLIEKIIVYEPTQRLGVNEQGGYVKLKEHVFFEAINWANLSEQEAPDPKINKTSTDSNSSN